MNDKYCVDANIFITAWNIYYPPHVFCTLWKQIAEHHNQIVLIKPIFDEIDPISSSDQKLSEEAKKGKYPLRIWMEDNHFTAAPVADSVRAASLSLEMEYETNDNPKGANQNDITLIAYAKMEGKIVVTFEDKQKQKPGAKCNYKIPLVCDEQGVECIKFVEMLDRLGIRL